MRTGILITQGEARNPNRKASTTKDTKVHEGMGEQDLGVTFRVSAESGHLQLFAFRHFGYPQTRV